MSDNKIPYFGYGANKTPQMMGAIVGKVPKNSIPIHLEDYELVVQGPNQFSKEVRAIVGIHRSPEEVATFSTYAIRPKAGETVLGTLWFLTPLERELVDNWELNNGLWYTKTDVSIKVLADTITASTEIIDDPSLTPASEMFDKEPPAFLNDEDRMIEVANIVREEYLASKK